MGLDQHLIRIRSFKHEAEDVVVTLNGEPITHVYEIREEVAYWRRANTIHDWLVNECNTKLDTFRVTRESLNALLTLCIGILAGYDEESTVTEIKGINVFEAMTTVDQLGPLLDSPESGPGYITFEYVAEY